MKHRPRKRFGQNFLVDQSVVQRIVQLISPSAGEHLVEIGPGQGAITRLLASQDIRLTVVELDRDLVASLTEDYAGQRHVTIHSGDALKTDFGQLGVGRPFRLVGNLPYNISTPLLFHAYQWRSQITDMTFMLQKEVVDRMAATPGSGDYGRLSVMTQYYCQVQPAFVVRPGAFYPPPKVDSRLVVLRPWDEAPVAVRDEKQLEILVRNAFSQRRKTLRNALKTLLDGSAIEAAGVDPGARAETLALADFARLANQLPEAARQGAS